MIYKKNWQQYKRFLEHRQAVNQLTKDSLGKDQTHLRYLLEWAQDRPFQEVLGIRPTFPDYMLSARLDDDERQLSAVYIKKVFATSRLFFTWLSDNEIGYKHIKQAWIKSLVAKRLSNTPQTKEIVTYEEILMIAARPARNALARRARAALVFLYLSGMRIGAFVSLPIIAVDIPNRTINQFPSLGVKTKNRKSSTTFLLDIPELLNVVQEWDNEVRSLLPPSGLWFAPFHPQTGQIDASITEAGEYRNNLARRNFKAWLQSEGLPYHSPHKFRHGHVHYLTDRAKNFAEVKAISQNVMHSSVGTTDQFYSVLNDNEVKNKISSLNTEKAPEKNDDEMYKKFRKFLKWERDNPA